MMNREVMSRQMFAKGGAAFPDLSGDGNVTQKDILIGRGVIPMQEGGMAPMPMSAAPGPQMMPPGLPPIDPNNVDINQAAQGAMQQGIDPAMLEGMLTQYSAGLEDLENAEDYETVMNGIRGDDQPIESRYQELASVVGPEDAQQTPESVLALVQPVMMMAAVDQGIGGLAAEEMNAPIEGAMAEGIMSTVNMGGPEAPAQVPGGPAPVNFNQGGAVQYMEPGGVALPNSTLQTLYDQELALRDQIFGSEGQAADLQEQRDMTKAGILFDIAQGALGFAGGAGRPGATPAEQLAAAFTPVVGNIGARAADLNKFQQSQKAQERQLKLGALQSAQSAYQADLTRKAAAANVKPGETYQIKDDAGKILWQGPIGTVGQQQSLMEKYPTAISVTEITEQKAPDYVTFINPNDPTDFHVFDKNNMSTSNQNKIEQIRQSVTADGKPLYRLTGMYTPPKDSGSSSSIQNFVLQSTGDTQMVDLSTAEGKKLAGELQTKGYIKAGVADVDGESTKPNLQVVVNKNDPTDIQRFNLNNPVEFKALEALDRTIYLPVSTPSMSDLADSNKVSLGNSFEARFMGLVANPDTLQAYANGTLAGIETGLINSFITNETRLKPVFDETLQRTVLRPGFELSPAVLNAITARSKIEGADMPTVGSTSVLEQGGGDSEDVTEVGRIVFDENGQIDFSSFENDHTFIITGVDLTKSQDWKSSVNRFFNLIAGQTGLSETGYAGEEGEITSKADTELKALARKIISVARSGVDGKVFALDIAMLKEEVDGFMPGGGRTDVGARDQLVTVRNNLAQMYRHAQDVIDDPAGVKNPDKYEKAEELQKLVENLIAETTAAIGIYDRYLSTDPISDAVSDRAATSSVTGGLSRASSGVDDDG
jgi:hypothetical protein